MAAESTELRRRICRACTESYSYPLPKERATRFHCSACAALPLEIRSVLEKYNRRLKALTAAVEKLEARCPGK